jgi:hypothetical protein
MVSTPENITTPHGLRSCAAYIPQIVAPPVFDSVFNIRMAEVGRAMFAFMAKKRVACVRWGPLTRSASRAPILVEYRMASNREHIDEMNTVAHATARRTVICTLRPFCHSETVARVALQV